MDLVGPGRSLDLVSIDSGDTSKVAVGTDLFGGCSCFGEACSRCNFSWVGKHYSFTGDCNSSAIKFD